MNNFCWTAQCDDEEGGAMKHETIVDNNEAELCNSIKLDKNTLQYSPALDIEQQRQQQHATLVDCS